MRDPAAAPEERKAPRPAACRLIHALPVLLTGFALLALAMLAGSAWQSRQDAFRNAESAADEAVDTLHEHALRILDSGELLLDLLALRTTGLSWSDIEGSTELKAYLKDLDDARSHVAALWLIDADGRIRATSAASPTPADVRSLDFFSAHRETNGATFIGRAYDDIGFPAFFTISRKRLSPAGTFDGVIVVAVDVGYFEHFFSGVPRGIRHRASLIRTDGEILARAPGGRRLPPLAPHDPFVEKMAAADAGLFWATGREDAGESLHGYRWLRAYPAAVTFSLDAPAILAPWYRTVALYTWMGAAVSLMLVFLALIALHQRRQERAAAQTLRAEMARRAAAEDALHHAQKLEAIGRLSGGIAHYFNNLLTAVLGSLDLLGERQLDARARDLVAAALRAAERAASLSGRLLTFARERGQTPGAMDINRIVTDMSEILSHMTGPRIEIKLALAPDLWPVQSDADHFSMAILNVAANARDAMPLGGVLTIETWNVPASGLDPSLQLTAGDYVLLAIGDNGVGMSAEVKARAFDPFFTTKEVGEGFGLGLSEVYGIAAQSGGTAAIDSRPGGGTTVRIYFPRHPARPAGNILAAGPSQRPGRAAILLVDDEPQVREFARTALEEAGYRVIEAARGSVALERLQTEPIDLLIADFGMSGMNGAQLAAEACARRPDLPVLLITGALHGLEPAVLGGIAVLGKPFGAIQLVERVRTMLAER